MYHGEKLNDRCKKGFLQNENWFILTIKIFIFTERGHIYFNRIRIDSFLTWWWLSFWPDDDYHSDRMMTIILTGWWLSFWPDEDYFCIAQDEMQKLGYEDGREEALMAQKRTLSEEVHHLRERVDGMTARYVSAWPPGKIFWIVIYKF